MSNTCCFKLFSFFLSLSLSRYDHFAYVQRIQNKEFMHGNNEMKRKHFNYRQQKPIEMVNLSLFSPRRCLFSRSSFLPFVVMSLFFVAICAGTICGFSISIYDFCALWIIILSMDLHYGRQSKWQHNYVSCVFRTMQKSTISYFLLVAIAYSRIVRDPEDRYADNREITCLK